MRKIIIVLIIIQMGVFLICQSLHGENTSGKPNIIYILADDLGFGDIKCNNPESKIPTPQIDKLAAEGISFTNGHSPAQICAPSRYSILTGRYYWRNEVYKEIGWRVVIPWVKPIIEEDRLTFPQMLKNVGYYTACIGKWHLGFDWVVKEGGAKGGNYKDLDYTKKVGGGPVTKGFDYFFGIDSPNSSYTFIENDRHTEIPSEEPYHAYAKARTYKTAKGWTFENILPTLTNKALGYIEKYSKEDEPFFLYFPLNGPHTPIAPSKEFIGKSKAGLYGDFVYQVDWVVGQIVEKLKKEGIYDNTVIIFSSDNGSPERDGTNYVGELKSISKFDHSPNHPFRGMKADLWEGGHRVPFIIRWPGISNPNSTSNVAVSQIDLMRTIGNYTGASLTDNSAEDSYDILTAIKGEKSVGHDPLIILDGDVVSIRSGNWKLIMHPGATGFSMHAGYKTPDGVPKGQLYNMKVDNKEQKNLYKEHPEIVDRLTMLFETIRDNKRSY